MFMFILKIVAAWNGMGMSVFALASRVLKLDKHKDCFPADEDGPTMYMEASKQVVKLDCDLFIVHLFTGIVIFLGLI